VHGQKLRNGKIARNAPAIEINSQKFQKLMPLLSKSNSKLRKAAVGLTRCTELVVFNLGMVIFYEVEALFL
jgi:hypothetical protein